MVETRRNSGELSQKKKKASKRRSKCGGARKHYTVKSKNNNTRTRCLTKVCKRVKDRRFHYSRPKSGHCGKAADHLGKQKLASYLEYRRAEPKYSLP